MHQTKPTIAWPPPPPNSDYILLLNWTKLLITEAGLLHKMSGEQYTVVLCGIPRSCWEGGRRGAPNWWFAHIADLHNDLLHGDGNWLRSPNMGNCATYSSSGVEYSLYQNSAKSGLQGAGCELLPQLRPGQESAKLTSTKTRGKLPAASRVTSHNNS